MSPPAPLHLSVEEYLTFESGAPIRHEFVGGVAHAVSGATLRHNLVAGALFSALRSPALRSGCRPYLEGAKLRIDGVEGSTRVYYPDVMVACEPSSEERWENAPCLLVEVLSPSTTVVDRREKLGAYLQIGSLETYLLVDPHSYFIEAHERVGRSWVSCSYGPGDVIALACPDVALAVDELWADLPET